MCTSPSPCNTDNFILLWGNCTKISWFWFHFFFTSKIYDAQSFGQTSLSKKVSGRIDLAPLGNPAHLHVCFIESYCFLWRDVWKRIYNIWQRLFRPVGVFHPLAAYCCRVSALSLVLITRLYTARCDAAELRGGAWGLQRLTQLKETWKRCSNEEATHGVVGKNTGNYQIFSTQLLFSLHRQRFASKPNRGVFGKEVKWYPNNKIRLENILYMTFMDLTDVFDIFGVNHFTVQLDVKQGDWKSFGSYYD